VSQSTFAAATRGVRERERSAGRPYHPAGLLPDGVSKRRICSITSDCSMTAMKMWYDQRHLPHRSVARVLGANHDFPWPATSKWPDASSLRNRFSGKTLSGPSLSSAAPIYVP